MINISGADIYVETTGSGEPALLLHGNPDSADMWQQVVTGIQQQYRCNIPDMPGYCRSKVPVNFEYTFDHYADFVNELADKLNLTEPFTLIMHDWGGIIGMAFAAKYPHRVKKIVGGDFPFHSSYRWHTWARIWRTPLLGELSLLLMNWPIFKQEILRGSPNMPPDIMQITYKNIGGWNSKVAVLKYYRSANPAAFAAFEKAAQALIETTPVHIIWGADDIYVPVADGKNVPHSEFTVVPNTGHWVPLENPQAYIDALV